VAVFTRRALAAYLDESGVGIRKILGELEGVSEETLRRIDEISRPVESGAGPIPHDPQAVMVYDRLVLLALAEGQLRSQNRKQPAASRKKQ
jgi:hypothetical protein